jgi:hypothetical protein
MNNHEQKGSAYQEVWVWLEGEHRMLLVYSLLYLLQLVVEGHTRLQRQYVRWLRVAYRLKLLLATWKRFILLQVSEWDCLSRFSVHLSALRLVAPSWWQRLWVEVQCAGSLILIHLLKFKSIPNNVTLTLALVCAAAELKTAHLPSSETI